MNRIVIHGGIITLEGNHAGTADYHPELSRILKQSYDKLQIGGAREAVLFAVTALEDCPLFNAGTGARIQADGEIRMSAALMDGYNNRFSGVINIQYVKNPIAVAATLATQRFKVLAGSEATRYARSQGFDSYSPYTKHRMREFKTRMATKTGTVGALAVSGDGIFAATSTGGVGCETPGRVSDSATVAGTYASAKVAISCTGAGEEIVNHAAAARVAVRVEDGMSLQAAVEKTIAEAKARGYLFGLIALDHQGHVVIGQTVGTTLYAYSKNDAAVTFQDDALR